MYRLFFAIQDIYISSILWKLYYDPHSCLCSETTAETFFRYFFQTSFNLEFLRHFLTKKKFDEIWFLLQMYWFIFAYWKKWSLLHTEKWVQISNIDSFIFFIRIFWNYFNIFETLRVPDGTLSARATVSTFNISLYVIIFSSIWLGRESELWVLRTYWTTFAQILNYPLSFKCESSSRILEKSISTNIKCSLSWRATDAFCMHKCWIKSVLK